MKQPLVLFVYEKLLPGGQLVNRLQDIGYRVRTLSDAGALVEHAERELPLLVIVDIEPNAEAKMGALSTLRRNSATSHIPVIAIASRQEAPLEEEIRRAGATLVVNDQAILVHLNELLQQALQVE